MPLLDSMKIEVRVGEPNHKRSMVNHINQSFETKIQSGDTMVLVRSNSIRSLLEDKQETQAALPTIDSLFRIELAQRGITEHFSLDTFTQNNGTGAGIVRHIIRDSTETINIRAEDQVFVFFEKNQAHDNNSPYLEAVVPFNIACKSYVRARFDPYNKFIISRMWGMIAASLLLSLLTAGAFIYLLYVIRQQRKVAELKSDFINAVTHELQTPIATASAAVEAMQRFNALENPARTQEYLGIAQHQLLQLSGMVDETLRLAAEERSHFNLKTEDVDIPDIVVPVMNHFLLQYGNNATISFENHLAYPIYVDREHFSWAIKNLVDNALKYGPAEHKEVQIKAWGEAAQWHLSVRDNGRGIPPEYQRKLFERFYRVPSDTNVKGFGLGLYIVRRIVEGHGGNIHLKSEPGSGSEFRISMNN